MRTFSSLIIATCAALLRCVHGLASPACPEEQSVDQVPDPAICALLDKHVRAPKEVRLDQYEVVLDRYLTANCHRDLAGGWHMDKGVPDTGPWIGHYQDGAWTGAYNGTHQPVLVWYSPEMYAWLKANRPV